MTATLFVRNEVGDFDTFKQHLDASSAFQEERGVLSASVHRDAAEPNWVIVTHQFEDIETARAFRKLFDTPEFAEGPGKEGTVVLESMQVWICEDV